MPQSSSLGACLAQFRPLFRNIFAGGVISLILMGVGLTIPGLMVRDIVRAPPADAMEWFMVGVCFAVGTGFVVGGVLLLRYARWLWRHRVELCENGFCYREGQIAEEVAWDAVASVCEVIRYERPPILKGPAKLLLPEMASASYGVTTTSGKRFAFDGNSINDIKRFGSHLRERAERAGVTWVTTEEHR